MTPEQQKAVAIATAKARARKAKGGGQMMQHVNRGIVDTVGGMVDFINPFDEPHALNPFGEGISAKRGLERGAAALDIDLADDPETPWQAAQQGTGEAMAALVPVAKGLQALKGAGGAVGQFADDAYRTLASYLGSGVEITAGGVSEAARQGAENAGAPSWVQDTAALAAPMGLAAAFPAAKVAGKAALNVGEKLPLSGPFIHAARAVPGKVAAAAAPYTNRGGRNVAHERLVELVGGKDRAEMLAARTRGENPLNLTPAEMTNDPGLLAVQREAARQDPALAARLADRAEDTARAARQQVGEMGGAPADAQAFFADRLRHYTARMKARADDALGVTERNVARAGTASRDPGENSASVMQRVDEAFRAAKVEETELWNRVPMDEIVPVDNARSVANSWLSKLGPVSADDIPAKARQYLLDENDVFGETASVRDMHQLYSSLRETARNARAGNKTQKQLALVADEIADAILKDLGAVDGATPAGRAINEARAASRALHETFDQGAVGRLMRKTNAGDTATDPELALERTIGRQGTSAMKADEQLTKAAGEDVRGFVADYIRGSFGERAFDANGVFTARGANGFIRSNRELLKRYPELAQEIRGAVGQRITAEDFAARIGKAVDGARTARHSAAQRFLDAPPEKAFEAVLSDKSPARAAAKLAAQARKDTSGRAMAGLKGAVSDYLIQRGFSVKANRVVGDGDAIVSILDDQKAMAAIRQLFTPQEVSRLKLIGRHLAQSQNAQRAQPEIGELVEPRAGRLIETIGRIAGAQAGAQMGGGTAGGSLQAAQIGSARVKEALGYLVSDKASQMLADAVEDPELLRALLTEVAAPRVERTLPRLVPYLVGYGATQIGE